MINIEILVLFEEEVGESAAVDKDFLNYINDKLIDKTFVL